MRNFRFGATVTCLVFAASVPGSANAATVTQSLSAPTTDIIAFADRADSVAGGGANDGFAAIFQNIVGGAEAASASGGQTFQFGAGVASFGLDAVTIQSTNVIPDGTGIPAPPAFNANADLVFTLLVDTDNDQVVDSTVSTQTASIGGFVADDNEYWRFALDTPLTGLLPNTVYAFNFRVDVSPLADGANVFRAEIISSTDAYPPGVRVLDSPATSGPSVTTIAGSDLTFYLQGSIVPTVPEPSTFMLVALGLVGLPFGARKRRRK